MALLGKDLLGWRGRSGHGRFQTFPGIPAKDGNWVSTCGAPAALDGRTLFLIFTQLGQYGVIFQRAGIANGFSSGGNITQ